MAHKLHFDEKNSIKEAENLSITNKDCILSNEQLNKLKIEGIMCLLGGFCLHLVLLFLFLLPI